MPPVVAVGAEIDDKGIDAGEFGTSDSLAYPGFEQIGFKALDDF